MNFLPRVKKTEIWDFNVLNKQELVTQARFSSECERGLQDKSHNFQFRSPLS